MDDDDQNYFAQFDPAADDLSDLSGDLGADAALPGSSRDAKPPPPAPAREPEPTNFFARFSPQPRQEEPADNFFAKFGPRVKPEAPEAEGMLATAGREAAHGLVPLAAFLPGAKAGAAAGTAVLPGWGTAIGALGGGLISSGLTYWGQEKALKAAADKGYITSDEEQRRVNYEKNPWSSLAGQVGPMGIVAGPGRLATPLIQRGIGAAAGLVFEGGQQVIQGELDPKRLAAQTAAGAVFAVPRAPVQRFMDADVGLALRRKFDDWRGIEPPGPPPPPPPLQLTHQPLRMAPGEEMPPLRGSDYPYPREQYPEGYAPRFGEDARTQDVREFPGDYEDPYRRQFPGRDYELPPGPPTPPQPHGPPGSPAAPGTSHAPAPPNRSPAVEDTIGNPESRPEGSRSDYGKGSTRPEQQTAGIPTAPQFDRQAFIEATIKGPEAVAEYARTTGMPDEQVRAEIYRAGDSNQTSEARYQRFLADKAEPQSRPAGSQSDYGKGSTRPEQQTAGTAEQAPAEKPALPTQNRFATYQEARANAQNLANRLGREVGIERSVQFGREGFTVHHLPDPKNRQGFELKAEVIAPHTTAEARTVAANATRTEQPASWVVRNKETGRAVMETFDLATAEASNNAKYEVVPIKQHLVELNQKGSLARTAAEAQQPKYPHADLSAGKLAIAYSKAQTARSKITDEMIAAGRGDEKPSETRQKTDPLSQRFNENSDALQTIIDEQNRRRSGHGSDKPLPRHLRQTWSTPPSDAVLGPKRKGDIFDKPLRRDVLERGRSGRPIRTEPLGDTAALTEAVTQRAEATRPLSGQANEKVVDLAARRADADDAIIAKAKADFRREYDELAAQRAARERARDAAEARGNFRVVGDDTPLSRLPRRPPTAPLPSRENPEAWQRAMQEAWQKRIDAGEVPPGTPMPPLRQPMRVGNEPSGLTPAEEQARAQFYQRRAAAAAAPPRAAAAAPPGAPPPPPPGGGTAPPSPPRPGRPAGGAATPQHPPTDYASQAPLGVPLVEPTAHDMASGFLASVRRNFNPLRSPTAEQASAAIREAHGTLSTLKDQAIARFSDKMWKMLNGFTPEQFRGFMKDYESPGGIERMRPEWRDVAERFKKGYDEFWGEVKKLPGKEQMEAVENYFSHMFEPRHPEQIKDFVGKWYGARGGSLKQRKYPTYEDAINAGLEPITSNPMEVFHRNLEGMSQFIAQRRVIDLMDKWGLIWRGRPESVGATGTPTPSVHDAPPVGYDKIQVPWAGNNAYAPRDAAAIVNQFYSAGLRGGSMKNVVQNLQHIKNTWTGLELGLSGYHFTTMFGESFASGFAKGLQYAAAGKLGKAAAEFAKTPAAPITRYLEGKRLQDVRLGLKAPDNPLEARAMEALEKANIRPGELASTREYDMTRYEDFYTAFKRGSLKHEMKEQLKEIYDAAGYRWADKSATFLVNQVARTMQTIAAPLFKYYIPRLKLGTLMSNMRQFLELNPHATDGELAAFARKAADSVDNRMGEMVADNLFMNKAVKDAGYLALRSFAWTVGGPIREIAGGAASGLVGALKGQNRMNPASAFHDPRVAYAMAFMPTIGLISAIYQYAKTGEAPKGTLDLIAPRTGGEVLAGKQKVPERIQVPGYHKDFLGYGVNPAGFWKEIEAKLAAPWSAALEQIQGKDWRGHNIVPPNASLADALYYRGKALGEKLLPISARQYEQTGKEGSKLSIPERLIGVKQPGGYLMNPRATYQNIGQRAANEWVQDQRVLNRQRAERGQPPLPVERPRGPYLPPWYLTYEFGK